MPECVLCTKPLGQDSIDLEYQVCKDCRVCPTCNQSVSPTESNWCLENDKPIKHARCMVLSDSSHSMRDNPLKLIEVINMCHLLIADRSIVPLMIKDMNFDQKFSFLQAMQSIAAETSVLIYRDKAGYKDELKERARQGYKKAKEQVERQEKSLPSVKTKTTKLDKFILSMAPLGIDRETAIKLFEEKQNKDIIQ